METKISDAGPFEKLVTFEITDDALEQAKNRAARKLSRSMKIPGFRPGKAPRRVVEATVGEERLRAEAIDEALPEMVGEALESAHLEPAATPAVESLQDVDGGVEVAVKVALWPRLSEPPNYVGREIEVPSPEVTEAEVEEQLDLIRNQFAEIEPAEEPASPGDYVSVDLSATRDGEPIPDVAAEALMIEVGGREFIEGLSDAVEGRTAGETVTFESTLPAGVRSADAGEGAEGSPDEDESEPVEYTVTINQVHVRRRPTLTDEWVRDNTEFDTLEDFISELRSRMADSKLGTAYDTYRSELIARLADEVDLDIPESIINGEMEEVLHRFSHTLSEQGVEIGDYLRASGQTEADFVKDLRDSAIRNVRTDLILDAVSDDAGLEVDGEEYDRLLDLLAAQSEQDPADLRGNLTESQVKNLRSDILRRKAHEALLKAAVPVDENGTPIDFETLASQLASAEDDGATESPADEDSDEAVGVEAAEEEE